MKLSTSDIELLVGIGFKQDSTKHSGYYYFEADDKTDVLIPQEDGTYKLESYELVDDGTGNMYQDGYNECSKPGQTLKEFITIWYGEIADMHSIITPNKRLNTSEKLDNNHYNLNEFNESQIRFIKGLVKFSYNEGLYDGKASIKSKVILTLDEE